MAIIQALQRVYRERNYTLLALLIAIAIVLIVNWLPNIVLLKDTLMDGYVVLFFILLYDLSKGVFTNNSVLSLVTTLVTGILAGVSISLLVFKAKHAQGLKLNESGTVTTGAIVGLISSGCSACSVGLLTSLGLIGGLSTLPFKGYEVWVLGVGLFVFSITMTSRRIVDCQACRIVPLSRSQVRK